MAREEFIHRVWSAADQLAFPRGETGSPHPDRYTPTKGVARPQLWLTPKTLNGFNSEDFTDLPEEKQKELREAVGRFQEFAAEVSPEARVTRDQARRGRELLEQVLALVREVLLPAWGAALDELVDQVTTWSRHQDWAVKRDTKRVRETLLGAYEMPRLLIHSPDGRLLLDPITPFAGAADGLVELCVMPSYDSAKLIHLKDHWYLHPLSAEGRRQPLSEKTFRKAVQYLLQTA